MGPNDTPEPDSSEAMNDAVDNLSKAQLIDRRSTLLTVGKYSAPLITALLSDKAKAFSF